MINPVEAWRRQCASTQDFTSDNALKQLDQMVRIAMKQHAIQHSERLLQHLEQQFQMRLRQGNGSLSAYKAAMQSGQQLLADEKRTL